MNAETAFWDAFAPDLALIEDSFFDRRALREIMPEVQEPVLVVGAGQGLLVGELKARGLRCDGVDFSLEMIRFAKIRRNLDLTHANAQQLPFANHAYKTVIYATGVIDFMADEALIAQILREGRRVLAPEGRIFVGFYRVSSVLEKFLVKVGLLENHTLKHRASVGMYLWSPAQTVSWVAKRCGGSLLGALVLFLRMAAGTNLQEKRNTFRMQKLFRDRAKARVLIEAAAETQPYRNEGEIRNLFERLKIPMKELRACGNCWIARL